ncbi:MAG TPA: hypothetical protein VLB27_03565, partial [candidate division Zixibacteria bacterium]|nr:hypothetical protein [candidate division Zixibacteria bacterium]
NGLRYRPDAAYRFGFSDEHDVPTAPLRTRPNNSFSQTISWRGSSGVNVFGGGVTTKVDVSESRTRSFPTTGAGSESVDRNWPRLTISIRQIRGFEKIFGINKIQGLLNSLIRRFQPQTSYGRRTSERRDLANDVVTSSSETIERSPLLAVNIPVRRQVTVNARIETSQVTRRQFELQTGRETGTTREKSSTVRLSTQYSFRAPQGIRLPIFGRVRIQSNVSLKLDILKRFSKRESKGPGQNDFIANGESDNFSVTFNSSYSFSTQVRGGVAATWTDSRSDARKSHTRELRIFAEMSF